MSSNIARANRALFNSVDFVVDFATLGEYRVVTDAAPREVEADDICAIDTGAIDIWAIDVEWSAPERDRTACSLPRARDRKLARSVVRG